MSHGSTGKVPLVSVCIPAYQAERHLGATIESVLAQTFGDWELIVLDNGSTDSTGAIARFYSSRDPRIRVERNPQTIPLADNWNAVASRAAGRYLKILCADDVLAPECLAAEVDALESHPRAVMVASRRDFIAENGEVVLRARGLQGLEGHRKPAEVVNQVVRSGINPIGWPSALLVSRRAFEAVGGFDPRWLYPIDLDLWLRLLSRGTMVGLGRTLVQFRIRHDAVSAGITDPGAQHRAVIRSFLESSDWSVGRTCRWWGAARSRVEGVRLRLLYRAVNSSWGPVRALPTVVLDRRLPGQTRSPVGARSAAPGPIAGPAAGRPVLPAPGAARDRSA